MFGNVEGREGEENEITVKTGKRSVEIKEQEGSTGIGRVRVSGSGRVDVEDVV